jgi:hypothetical protein
MRTEWKRGFWTSEPISKEAARQIDIGTGSFTPWMRRHCNPTIRRWLRLIEFLEYDPQLAAVGIGPALVRWR